MRPLVIGLVMLVSCTSSGPARASTACDLLRPSEIEAVLGDSVSSSGPSLLHEDPASPFVTPSSCAFATNGQWGSILVTMQRPGRQAYDADRDRARVRLGFVETTVSGHSAFLEDGGGGLFANDTYLHIGAQNAVHFSATAQRLLTLAAPRA
ncbi:MAG: hypothetical protein QOD92_2086 [Acidimicrobiaceae bacterium]